ncbi:MAG: hypothetical protein RIR10_1197 [Planctomycetota bacterium]
MPSAQAGRRGPIDRFLAARRIFRTCVVATHGSQIADKSIRNSIPSAEIWLLLPMSLLLRCRRAGTSYTGRVFAPMS